MARSWISAGRRMLPAFGFALSLSLGAASGTAWAQEDPRAHFRQWLSLFDQGKYDEALKEADKFLAANPSSDLALEMENEAGYQVFVEMIARRDGLGSAARKVLELAEQGAMQERMDAEKIQALIADMWSDDFEKSYKASELLATRVGPFVVPYMVEFLAERRDSDKRTKAIVLCTKLGPDGTTAMIALLRHKDDFVRQNACAILGHIRDFKAIPYLKATAERSDESSHVRDEARSSLKKITGKDQLDPAIDFFLALGERYYQEDARVMWTSFKDRVVWGYQDDKLTPRIVPAYAWNEKQVEDCCYAAIQHVAKGGEGASEAALDRIYTLLVSALMQEYVEVRALSEIAEQKATAGFTIDPAEVEALKAAREKLANLPAYASAKGEAQLCKALKKALQDRRPELAVAIMNELRQINFSETSLPAEGANLEKYLEEGAPAPKAMDVAAPASRASSEAGPTSPTTTRPPPVVSPEQPKEQPKAQPKEKEEPAPQPEQPTRRRHVSMATDGLDLPFGAVPVRTLESSGEGTGAAVAAALSNDDKRVRYAAAEALLRLGPSHKFAGWDKVVSNLGSAVQESGSRLVFVIARDVQVRNRLLGEVRNMNHLPFAMETAKQGIVRARGAAGLDAIMLYSETNVNGENTDYDVAQFLDQINADYRTSGTPVIVVVPSGTVEEKQKLFTKAQLVVGVDSDAVILKDQLEALWTGGKAKPGDPKAKAVELAKHAAEALAAANPKGPVFDLKPAVPGLMQAIESQPDAVRVPALRALGNIHARECVDKAAAIFDNPQNSKEVRIAAAFCLGEALRGGGCPQKVFESLKGGLKEGDPGLYQSCAEALGKTNLSKDQARDAFLEMRMD